MFSFSPTPPPAPPPPPLLSLRPPLARLNKQPRLGGDTLTVTALDVPVFRALSARLINTSFSFNGAAAPQPSQEKDPLFGSFTALPGGAAAPEGAPRPDEPIRAELVRASCLPEHFRPGEN